MAYSLTQIDNATIRLTFSDSYVTGASLAVKFRTITPATYALLEYKSTYLEGAIAAIGTSGYKDDSSAEELYYFKGVIVTTTVDIPLVIDAVYRIDIMETFVDAGTTFTPTRLHFFVSTYTLDSTLLTKMQDIVCCCNIASQNCVTGYCASVYDFNALSNLSFSYFGRWIDVAINYGSIIPTESFIIDNLYKCLVAGGPIDYDGRIMDMFGTVFGVGTTIVDDVYMCVHSGEIVITGGTFTAYTDEFEDQINYIADAINRVSGYIAGCTTNNTCSCT